jgi:hypothetical protein
MRSEHARLAERDVGGHRERRLRRPGRREVEDHIVDRAQMTHLADGDAADFSECRPHIVAHAAGKRSGFCSDQAAERYSSITAISTPAP